MDNTDDFDAIYAAVRTIPAGRVMSYGQIGVLAGADARTVGFAMATCPKDVPWQRVVGSDGALKIARRSANLKTRQQTLLEAEGVVVAENSRVERRFFVGAEAEEEAKGNTETLQLPGLL